MRSALLSLTIAALLVSAAPAAEVEGFESTWSQAVAKAKEQNKPIYLHFTTEWCGWCRKIEKDTYKSETGQKALESFVAASLDCTVPRGQQPTGEKKTNIELMRKWGGRGYPYLVMVTPDGQVLNTVSGYVKPEQFKKETDQALATWKELKAFGKYAKTADKSSLEYNKRAMKLYATTKQWDKANQAAEVVLEKDADNAKGLYEQATMVKVQYLVNQLQSAKSAEQAKPTLKKLHSLLSALVKKDIELDEPFRVHYLLGGISASMGNMDDAIASMQTAKKHAPNQRAKTAIDRQIQQLKGHSHDK